MSQTVIGFFDDRSDAQKAVEKLESAGIGKERIDFSGSTPGIEGRTSNSTVPQSHDVNPVSGSERDENSVRTTSDDRTVDREGRNTNKFTDFFNNLFGGHDNDDSAERYRHVAERSGAIVTVHAETREEAERAAHLLDDCGAVDVDEKASQSGYRDLSNRGIPREGSSSLSDESRDSNQGQRSRIIDRRIEDHMRLRGNDDHTGFASSDTRGY